MTTKRFTTWCHFHDRGVLCIDVYSLWFSHRLLANPSRCTHNNSVRKFSALFNNSVGKCCLHSFYLLSLPHLTSAYCKHPLLWSESKPTTRNESSRELSFLGAKVPTGNFRCEERKYLEAKNVLIPVEWAALSYSALQWSAVHNLCILLNALQCGTDLFANKFCKQV